ncbi:hypothetical protein V2W45_30484 [Cenococcum geophilum]
MPLPHLEHEALSEGADDEALQDHVILLDSDAVIPETQFDDPFIHHFNHNGRGETPLSPTSVATIRDLSINSSQATSLTSASFSKSLSLLKRPASAEDDPVITFKFTIPKRPGTNISGGPSDPHSASQGDRRPSGKDQRIDAASFQACTTTLVPLPAGQRSDSSGSDKPRGQKEGRPAPSLEHARSKVDAIIDHRNEESLQGDNAPSRTADQSIVLEGYDNASSNNTLSHKPSQKLPVDNEVATNEYWTGGESPTVTTGLSQREASVQSYATIPRTDTSRRKPRKPINKTKRTLTQATQDTPSGLPLPLEGPRDPVQSRKSPAGTSEDIIDVFQTSKSNVLIPQMAQITQHNMHLKSTPYPLDPEKSLMPVKGYSIPTFSQPSKGEIHSEKLVYCENKKTRTGSMLDDDLTIVEIDQPVNDGQDVLDSEIPFGVHIQNQHSPRHAAAFILEQSSQNAHSRAHPQHEIQQVKSKVSGGLQHRAGSPTNTLDDSVLHVASSHTIAGKVVKPKKKEKTLKPKLMPPNHLTATTQGGLASLPSVPDVLQVLGWTLQHEQGRAVRAEVEKSKLKDNEINELILSERLMQGKLQSVKKENEELSKKLIYQKEKLTGLQKYVNGLGNDLQKVRAESKAFYNECCNTLSEQRDEYEQDRATMRTEFSAAILQSRRVQDHAKEAFSETYAQTKELHRSKDYLEQQLSEKVGLLVEERSLRSNLEKHLQASSADQGAIKKRLDENNQILIEKLSELQSIMKRSQDNSKSQTAVDECIEVVRSLQSRESVTPKDIEKAEAMLQYLLQTMNSHFRKLTDQVTSCQFPKESFERELGDKLKALKDEVLQNETLQTSLASIRESNATLSEHSLAQEQKVSELQENLETAKENELCLKSQIALLEGELINLKSMPAPSEREQYHLNDLQAENSSLRGELDNAKGELISSMNKLSSASVSEQALRDEISELREHVEGSATHLKKAIFEKEETEKNVKELTAMPSSMFTDLEFQASNRINEVRNKLNKDANRLRHEQQAEFENALHQANQAKMEKEKSLEVTFGELVRLKQSLQAVEEQLRTKDSTINRLEQERGENEIMLKKVQQSLRETENVSKEIETIKDRLVAEIKASQIKSDEINKLNTGQATSTSKIETLEQSLVQAKANAIEYQEKMRQLREYFNSELLGKQSSSKEELRQAQDQIIATENAKRELESALDHSRKRAEAQIREIQDKNA